MRNSSEKFLTWALFVLNTVGLQLFSMLHTLLIAIPDSLFCNIGVLVLATYLIAKEE